MIGGDATEYLILLVVIVLLVFGAVSAVWSLYQIRKTLRRIENLLVDLRDHFRVRG